MKLTCAVCGYDKIDEPKLRWSICPCCGTQFGLSDCGRSHEELRATWILNGAIWNSAAAAPVAGWDPIAQLRNINYTATDSDRRQILRYHQELTKTGARFDAALARRKSRKMSDATATTTVSGL